MKVIYTKRKNYFDITSHKDDDDIEGFRIDFESDELYTSYLKFKYTKDNIWYDIF